MERGINRSDQTGPDALFFFNEHSVNKKELLEIKSTNSQRKNST